MKKGIPQLREHDLYRGLSPLMQAWVEHFVRSHDKVAAAEHSVAVTKGGVYKSRDSAKNTSDRYLRDWRIRRLLSWYEEREIRPAEPMEPEEVGYLILQKMRETKNNPKRLLTYVQALMTLNHWYEPREALKRNPAFDYQPAPPPSLPPPPPPPPTPEEKQEKKERRRFESMLEFENLE